MAEPGIPIVDVAPLVSKGPDGDDVASEIRRACREHGFFYVVGHGIEGELLSRIRALSREFFALPLEEKLRIRMERGGRALSGIGPAYSVDPRPMTRPQGTNPVEALRLARRARRERGGFPDGVGNSPASTPPNCGKHNKSPGKASWSRSSRWRLVGPPFAKGRGQYVAGA